MRQRGQPTSNIEVASGLFGPFSDETQELGGDNEADRVGDNSILLISSLGGDRFSFKSSFGPVPFLRLILCFSLFSATTKIFIREEIKTRLRKRERKKMN